MGDHASTTNSNETTFTDKGKGKAQDPTQDQNMESESESESEPELVSLRINSNCHQDSGTDQASFLARQRYEPCFARSSLPPYMPWPMTSRFILPIDSCPY
jgi:hypothetical protein